MKNYYFFDFLMYLAFASVLAIVLFLSFAFLVTLSCDKGCLNISRTEKGIKIRCEDNSNYEQKYEGGAK